VAFKRSRKKMRWLLVLAIIIIPMIYFSRRAVRFISALNEEHRLQKNILVIRAENQATQQRIDDYRKGVLLETKARDELGMIKKGEKVYLIKR